MVLQFIVFAFSLTLWLQGTAAPAPLSDSDCLIAMEKQRLSAEQKIDGRVKVYRDISERLRRDLVALAAKQSFEEAPTVLHCWMELITVSVKDIEANINRKKKSGALINYEIQLRKSIVDMSDARLKAPYQQQDNFESWLSQANVAHEKFVDILFQR
jgi:hypothetical protein